MDLNDTNNGNINGGNDGNECGYDMTEYDYNENSKKYLRELYKYKRMNISTRSLSIKSSLITRKIKDFIRSKFKNKKITIHTFIPAIEYGEINVWKLVDFFEKEGHKIIVPKMGNNFTLQHYEYYQNDPLVRNKYGILEPYLEERKINNLELNNIHLIIVPLIIVDYYGNRIGYGSGFYDRFLNNINQRTITVGISLFEPTKLITDIKSFDVPVKYIITPDKIIKSFCKS